ncbi:hypothetical protein FACS189411_04550 [Bacteroidia bacterium]|nr:hypothetical protein FACS189411_04550 [Bacteroidia bacterium]
MDLLKKRTTSSLNEAIKKFETAKRCYNIINDADGVKKCDTGIAECYMVLNASKSGLSVSKEDVNFSPTGGSETISIAVTGNVNWSISSFNGWYTAAKDGDQITIKAEANEKPVARSQAFTIKYGSKEVVVKVSQEADAEKLSLSGNDIYFPANFIWDKVITVTTNVDWTFTGVPEWCNVVKADNFLILSPSTNEEPADRKATISISAGSKKEELRISQENDYISVEPPLYQAFEQKKGSRVFVVKFAHDQVIPLDISNSHSDWCKVSISKDDNRKIIVECLANKDYSSREDTIHIKKRSQDIAIPIFQNKTNSSGWKIKR